MYPIVLPQVDVDVESGRLLAQTVQYAFDRSKFYRRKFTQAGLDPKSIETISDLARIPVTEKQELSHASRDAWCVPITDVVDITTTSGTTGQSLLVPLTQTDIERLAEVEAASFSCAGVGSHDVALLSVTMDRCFMAGLAYYGGLRRLGATAIRCGAHSPGLICEMIDHTAVTVIVSVPSLLARLTAYALAHGLDLRGSSVKKIVCIGEPVRDCDFELTPLTHRLEQAFDAEVFGSYGATELVSSMCECEYHKGNHLQSARHYVEILDEQDRPVASGQSGQMVVTTFGVQGMPLIRYRLGDIATIHTDPCACGRCSHRLGPVLGRRNHMLKIRGTTVHPTAVRQVLSRFEHVDDYLMIATSPEVLSDELELLISLRDGHDRLALIEESLHGALKVRVNVRVVDGSQLDQLRGDGVGRKKQYFVDQRRSR